MKRIAATLALLTVTLTAGCAHAAVVKFFWTNPRFNAQAPPSCAAAADTLRDLATVQLAAIRQGATDTLFVAPFPERGREALADSAAVDLAKGIWSVMVRSFDLTGNVSCWSNVVQRAVLVPPVAPVLKP